MRPTRERSAMSIQPWRAEASGVPDMTINDCTTMLTGFGDSKASEQRRQAGLSHENALFVNEMKATNHNARLANPPLALSTKMTEEDLMKEMVEKKNKKIMMTLEQVDIDASLTITAYNDKRNTWHGFVADKGLYLRGDGWADMDIRESIVAVIELAEEQLACEKVYLCLEKANPDLAAFVRSLMYAGFEVVSPGVLPNADPKYLVLGMEL